MLKISVCRGAVERSCIYGEDVLEGKKEDNNRRVFLRSVVVSYSL